MDVLKFAKEWERRRSTEPMGTLQYVSVHDLNLGSVTEQVINDLEKWSDEHALMTRLEKYVKTLSDAGFDEETVRLSLKYHMCEMPYCMKGDCEDCIACWNEQVEG